MKGQTKTKVQMVIFMLLITLVLCFALPMAEAKPKIKLEKGDVTDELNSYFILKLKLDDKKIDTSDFNVLYVWFVGETALIKFEVNGERYWYMTNKIKIK